MRFFTALLLLSSLVQAEPNELETAAAVDAKLVELLQSENTEPAAITTDEDFLRRVNLDLAGRVPTPQETTLFGIDPNPGKRSQKIDELLDSPEYAKIWASYWREVIFSRATEQRTRLVIPGFESWMEEQFASNRPWDEITRELLTATGDVQEEGRVGLMFAHFGEPAELAAEVSRIFMGIQMSCANCHDHPTDSWKRKDFHELAAYFSRVQVRRTEPQDPRSFAVMSMDRDPQANRRRNVDPEQIFRFMDRNRDGKLEKSEARGPLADRFDRLLEGGDADKDGKVSLAEFQAAQERIMNVMQQPGRGSLEYYMPDLENPSAQGTLMQPVFFVSEAKGPRVRTGSDDLTRRSALADYITSPTNPWFAKAFVNRVWAEMLGQGFYSPIDDMGPERFAVFEEALDILADGFVASGYDVKWLYRTIANTDAYQRQIQSRDAGEYVAPFAAAAPTRLRSDQIYNVFQQVLGIEGFGRSFRGQRGGGGMGAGFDPGRLAFSQLFGFDPSTPQVDILGNVPQALFMMNSPQLESLINADGDTKLGRILRKFDQDEDAINELYLLVLAREPSATEQQIASDYITEVGKRNEAFEDLMWSLMNSTEFISKR